LDDRAFKKLDLLVATAGSHGIRLVLPLINYEPDILGMQYVVDRLHPGAPKEIFYASQQVPLVDLCASLEQWENCTSSYTGFSWSIAE
jgi:hypothetical protein